ncbi:hypothetical protein KY385_03430 [Candidatus Parcubacteria bacterium]|nr:hypothetical protein [Candidatus Parcubacteria bacterium]
MKTAGNALISVFDKTGIEEFARELADLGWTIYASGGTAEVIKKAGVEVIDTVELSKSGPILDHRVVTLSREIYAGILASDDSKHQAELKKLKIPRIDLVCVDMYPLRDEINKSSSTEASIIEKTDVGGPSLLHAAAKGRRIVLSKASQRTEVIKWLKAGKPNEKSFKYALAAAAELEVADYMLESAKYLNPGKVSGNISERLESPKYGENPWQGGAGFFTLRHNDDPLAIGKFKLIEGVGVSYNNYTDVDRILQTITHVAAGFERNFNEVPPIALGAKHGNLCGAGIDSNPGKAIEKMLSGDQRAIFGGSVAVNFRINKDTARTLMKYKVEQGKRILDVVMAPGVDEDALEILKRKNGKLRVLVNPELGNLTEDSLEKTERVKCIRGGRLRQQNYTFIYDLNHPQIEWAGKKVTKQQEMDMIAAWAVGSTTNSNTICLFKNGMLLSNGAGQQDRVTAAELALMRAKNAGHDLKGASAYSDSFFPFTDGPQMLVDAGIRSIITSRGSVRDNEVIEVLNKAGASFVTLPDAICRGFFGH